MDPAETAAEQPAEDAAVAPIDDAEVEPDAADATASGASDADTEAPEEIATEPTSSADESPAPEDGAERSTGPVDDGAPATAATTEAAETTDGAETTADTTETAETADTSDTTAATTTEGTVPEGDGSGTGAEGEPAPPESAAARSGLRSGQLVIATVDAVDAEEVAVTLPDGAAGVIGKRHLSATGQIEPSELLSPGDQVEAAVLVRDDPKGRIVLSRAWALKQRAWEKIEAALKSHQPVTGQVTGQVKGGLVVDVGTRAFLPASHVDLHHVDDLAPFIGQPIEALVAEADRANDKIVLSRRNLLRQHERAKANEFAATLAAGQVHRGRVSLLTDFGAFVDIAGVRGLVHLSELSWSRVERAADVVSVGEEIEVKVLGIKPGKKLSLSLRALNPDPLTTLREGEILPGVVTRLADFGAFVRVASGAEGLVHVTELAEYRVHAPEEVVAPGDEVLVKVLRVDRRRRRLDLSVNQAVLHQ